MNELIKHLCAMIAFALTRVFCLFKIQNKKIIFESYAGTQYSCNPKYICRYIANHSCNYNIIWVNNGHKLNDCIFPQVKRNTLRYFYHILTAKTIVINSGKNRLLKFRPQQVIINTWHGGGAYKKIPASSPDYLKYYGDTVFLSSCAVATKYVINDGLKFSGTILNCGSPRNDILFHYKTEEQAILRQKFHVNGKKCVLYAPTFRDNRFKTDFGLDCERLIKCLKLKFSGDWIILKRCHYNMINNDVNMASEAVLDVTDYPDVQELLLITDVLVTDYSSVIWDYSFLCKPAFLFAPDLEEYYKDRSFYVDIKKWPFSLAINNDELEKNIMDYNQEKCEQQINKHHVDLGSFETGEACVKVYDYIKSRTN